MHTILKTRQQLTNFKIILPYIFYLTPKAFALPLHERSLCFPLALAPITMLTIINRF